MRTFLYAFILIIAAASARAQASGLDTSFGSQGIVMVGDTALSMQNNRMALQSDHKIVVAGSYFYYLPNFDLVYTQVIMRFNPDGSRDSSFNHTGSIAREVPRGTRISGVAIQSDNRILVSANTYIERYLPDGTPDSSFSDSSRFTFDFLGTYDAVNGLALQPDGKILVCGGVFNDYAMLFRLKTNGTPDTAFGYNGLVNTTLDSSAFDVGYAVTVQPDGKILLAGSSTIPRSGNYYARFAIIRYLSDGTLDPAFNNGKGYCRADFPNQVTSAAYFVGIQPGGKIITGGNVFYNTGGSMYRTNSGILRFSADGVVDSTFGLNGRIVDDTLYNGISIYRIYPRMNLQPDGKILMALSQAGTSGSVLFALHRFNANGFIDMSFGSQGIAYADITVNQDMPNDVAVQPDGKLLVCGISDVTDVWPQSQHSFPALVRFEPNAHLGIPGVSDGIESALVYPNPAGSSLTLKYELSHDDVLNIYLTDIRGRMVQYFIQDTRRSGGIHTEYFALSPGLAPGNYFLTVNGSSGLKTIKIVHE